jgi:hypothetical protein
MGIALGNVDMFSEPQPKYHRRMQSVKTVTERKLMINSILYQFIIFIIFTILRC